MTGSRRMAALLGVIGATTLASTTAAAEPMTAPPGASPASVDGPTTSPPAPAARFATIEHGPGPRRNALVLGTHAKIPDWATSLTYQRALGRRFSLGAGLEYGYQTRGYWHLQGVGESLSGQVWLGRAFHGVFAEGSLTVLHQVLVRQPRLSTTALAPGLSLGFRWTHRSGLTVGASAGLRWGRMVGQSDLVCTRPKYCNSVRQGPYARFTADLGYVF